MYKWEMWLEAHWDELKRGRKLMVDQHALPHPGQSGSRFKRVVGWPVDQSCDWGLSIDDGSRIHVQCFTTPEGQSVYGIHRDRWDPSRDVSSALMHVAFETPLGAAGLAGASLIGIVAIVGALGARS